MKKLISEPKGCILSMLSLVFICETLLSTNNRFFQTVGILISPFIIVLSIMLVKVQTKKTNN